MDRTIRFHPEAEIEFREAILWYQNQQRGVELEFVRCIDEAVERIRRTPEHYPIVYKNLRRAVVRRFPFIIIFECLEKEIRVVAIFHSKRNPKILKLTRFLCSFCSYAKRLPYSGKFP
jgi:plasmid stabilization system protein ParE